MNIKGFVIKKLNEVAGISFEVRKWAQVIENYVKDYVAKEREKLQNITKIEPKKDFSWSYDDDSPGDNEFQTSYTHFESHGGDKYDSGKVYGSELYINPDILDEYPNIKKIIQDKLFEVELDGKGEFTVDTVGSSFPDNYLYGILEIIQDRMVMGDSFYTNSYDEIFAVIGDTEDEYGYYNYYDYMNEENRWSNYGSYSYTPQPRIDKISS